MITIQEVLTKAQWRIFAEFANQLYKENPYYVPDLPQDVIDTYDRTKNPAYDFCESICFLAYEGNTAVGRIAGIINHNSNQKWQQAHARFAHLDFLDNIEISTALIKAVKVWAASKGMTHLKGPLGMTDLDHQGMLIEGFQEQDMFITYYNSPYYARHMEQLGFYKDADWIEYQIAMPSETDPQYQFIHKMAAKVGKRHSFKLLHFRRKRKLVKEWGKKIFDLYNSSYAPLYGTTDLTERQADYYIKTFLSFVNPDFIKIVVNSDMKIVAFGVTLPSLSKALQKCGGKLFPFGIFYLLNAIKHNDVLDLYLVGVLPEYQNTGVNALLMDAILKECHKYQIKIAETGPTLENNLKIQAMWKHFDKRQHRRRRSWISEIN
ncbi:N-acetyltransferase [Clostridiales bacterium COT073_COT-073]|nr:N-acetyltransferase [Clostridiales bacterium COT073_COT-073]